MTSYTYVRFMRDGSVKEITAVVRTRVNKKKLAARAAHQSKEKNR